MGAVGRDPRKREIRVPRKWAEMLNFCKQFINTGSTKMKKMFSNYPDVISINELTTMLNISKNTAYSLLQSGAIKSIKVGKQYRIPKQFIIEYLKCN